MYLLRHKISDRQGIEPLRWKIYHRHCTSLNMYTEHTHITPRCHGSRLTNTCIMNGGHYHCVLSLPAVYSWDEIGEKGQNYNSFIRTLTQQWLSYLECLKRHKKHFIFVHLAGFVVKAVQESCKIKQAHAIRVSVDACCFRTRCILVKAGAPRWIGLWNADTCNICSCVLFVLFESVEPYIQSFC